MGCRWLRLVSREIDKLEARQMERGETRVEKAGRGEWHVYRMGHLTDYFIGAVEKDATGNWVALNDDGRKLSELRPVVGGERDFNYFATRKAAVAALVAVDK